MYDAGFRDVLLDVPALYARTPDLVPAAVAESLRENVAWYAQQLLQRRYFRVEPFSELFDAVHQGKPIMRVDDAGCGELAVDSDGNIYPSPDFLKQQEFALGRIDAGRLNATIVQTFEALGTNRFLHVMSVGRAACAAAGMQSSTDAQEIRAAGSAWCDAQREWLAISWKHLMCSCRLVSTSPRLPGYGGNAAKMSWWKAVRPHTKCASSRVLQENVLRGW